VLPERAKKKTLYVPDNNNNKQKNKQKPIFVCSNDVRVFSDYYLEGGWEKKTKNQING